MDASSPLAALQPQPVPFGRHHWNHSSLDARLSTAFKASNNFDFKDMSMKTKHTGYFDLRPSRTASPTAALAVDLSRNFHLDRRQVVKNLKLLYLTIVLVHNLLHPEDRCSVA